jgi:hypothetical protein
VAQRRRYFAVQDGKASASAERCAVNTVVQVGGLVLCVWSRGLEARGRLTGPEQCTVLLASTC